MEAYITSKDELDETVRKAVKDLIEKELPSLLRKAKRKEWINTNELMELTGWSRRKIQYLRDEREIPFFQRGHRILYKTEEIEEYFRENKVQAKD